VSRLTWDALGNRNFETGVDRGVLYPTDQPGVAWQGLISVSENVAGGEAKGFYLDGEKFLNLATPEEFEATIRALYRPDEFAILDGNAQPFPGLSVTRQRRQSFGFSFRTILGNDAEGIDYGYKIHLVYNALAAPSAHAHITLNDSANPEEFNWDITATPPVVPGYKNTAHLIIDSTQTLPLVLSNIEDVLYGTETEAPRLLTPAEVLLYFDAGDGIVVTDNGDGTFTVFGFGDSVIMLDDTTFQITSPTAVFIDSDSYTVSSA